MDDPKPRLKPIKVKPWFVKEWPEGTLTDTMSNEIYKAIKKREALIRQEAEKIKKF